MLNEHHNAPFCMQARTNMFGAILAAITKRVKIVLLGNPLPLTDNPVQLAEELAMIDMISKGRLVSGFVRGGGQEQLANGVNPAFNRERFDRGARPDPKTWTEHGPFRWEGTHYQHRVVNPWALPLQKPYPRVWIPGVLSKETVIWTAQQRYPYIALNTSIEATKTIWETYDKAAAEVGYTAGPENFGYLIRVHVQDTEEKALENARQFMWMQGEFTGLAQPGLGESGRLFLAVGAARLRRVRRGAGEEPARQSDLRGAGRRYDDHRRDAGPGDRAAEVPGRRPVPASWASGATTGRSAGRPPALHRIACGEVMPAIKEWCEVGAEGPVGGECAGASALLDRHPGAEGSGRVAVGLSTRRAGSTGPSAGWSPVAGVASSARRVIPAVLFQDVAFT